MYTTRRYHYKLKIIYFNGQGNTFFKYEKCYWVALLMIIVNKYSNLKTDFKNCKVFVNSEHVKYNTELDKTDIVAFVSKTFRT